MQRVSSIDATPPFITRAEQRWIGLGKVFNVSTKWHDDASAPIFLKRDPMRWPQGTIHSREEIDSRWQIPYSVVLFPGGILIKGLPKAAVTQRGLGGRNDGVTHVGSGRERERWDTVDGMGVIKLKIQRHRFPKAFFVSRWDENGVPEVKRHIGGNGFILNIPQEHQENEVARRHRWFEIV